LEAFERLGAVRRFAADCFFALVRRLLAVRRLAVVRRFEVVRRFTADRFFRVERVVAARFLRFAICCLLGGAGTLSKKIFSQRGAPKSHNGHQTRVTGAHSAGWTNLASSATETRRQTELSVMFRGLLSCDSGESHRWFANA
jgi:hypothetical protein